MQVAGNNLARASKGVLAIAVLVLAGMSTALFPDFKPIVIHATYDHDKFGTLPRDTFRQMGAYVVRFDGDDDNNGNGTADCKANNKTTTGRVTMPGSSNLFL